MQTKVLLVLVAGVALFAFAGGKGLIHCGAAAADRTSPATAESGAKAHAGRTAERDPVVADTTEARLVRAWSEAHSLGKVDALTQLYAPEVKWYGKPMSRDKAVSGKRALLAQHPEFRQAVGAVTRESSDGERTKVTFDKVVTMNGETKTYPSYLVFVGTSIVEESDVITDANLRTGR